MRTLAGNGEPGFADGQGAAVRFNHPGGLAVDVDGSILVTDRDIRAHGHRAPGVGAQARARGGARVGDGVRGAAHQDHSGAVDSGAWILALFFFFFFFLSFSQPLPRQAVPRRGGGDNAREPLGICPRACPK